MTQEIEQAVAFAIELHQKSQFAQAEAAYVDVLRIDPTHHQALLYLGLLYESAGHMDRAIELLRQTIAIHPQSIDAYYNLGLFLFRLKRYDEAIVAIEQVIVLQPAHCAALNTRGLIAYEINRYEEALTYFNQVLTLDPNDMSALNGTGLTLKEIKKYEEALSIFEKALVLYPGNHMLLYNKSLVLFLLRQYNYTLVHLDEILTTIEPNYIKALDSKASTLVRLGRIDEVIECYQKIIALDPKHNTARSELIYGLLCVCDWKELDKHIAAMQLEVAQFTLDEKDIMLPLIGHLLPGWTLQQHYELSHRYAMQISQKVQVVKQKINRSFIKEAKKKLTIGYISNDFRVHPLSQLIPEMLALHDRKRVTIFAYSNGPNDKSPMRHRIEQAVDYFVDIEGMDVKHIAQRIQEDRIDILVDLTGYSWATPTPFLALRLAPIQVSYLGYLGTMAADFIDAIIADEFVIPASHQQYYAEKIYYLPCYQPNDRQCKIAVTPSREECGLPEGALVFCCFNATCKITPAVFSTWCRLLKEIPNSVLWLLASNKWAVNNLQQEAQRAGIDSARLIFANSVPLDQHLARLQCADLFLDTHTYNAGTTASNALWAGLPIVTCVGESFPSRMAGSLLNALQVPELITYHADDYYQLALTLATDHEKRNAIREKIKTNRNNTVLFDTPLLTQHLEDIYFKMWEDYLA